MFEAVQENEKSLAGRVAARLLQMIADQNLSCGEKLPNEFDLADQLRVGRGTVREAVKLLVSRNILEIRRGKGTFVAQNPGLAEDPLGLTFFQDKYKLVMDLVEIRFMLEPRIAALAAERASDEDIMEMKRLCAAIGAQQDNGKNAYIQDDVALHTRIAQSTRNLVVPTLIPIIHSGIELYNKFPSYVEFERQEALSVHPEIIAAIERHDPEQASEAMIRHLTYNKKNLVGLEAHIRTTSISP